VLRAEPANARAAELARLVQGDAASLAPARAASRP
jgi:hypothetical protein